MTVASSFDGLHQRLMPLFHNHHTSSLTYQPCCKHLNQGKKPFNTQYSILDNKKTLQPYGNVPRSQLKAAIWTCHHHEKDCIISCWLILSPPCGPSATNNMNCLLVALKRHHWNCYCVVLNVFCIIEMTEILTIIDVVFEVGKSLEIPSNVVLLLPLWHSTPLGQVIKGLDFLW